MLTQRRVASVDLPLENICGIGCCKLWEEYLRAFSDPLIKLKFFPKISTESKKESWNNSFTVDSTVQYPLIFLNFSQKFISGALFYSFTTSSWNSWISNLKPFKRLSKVRQASLISIFYIPKRLLCSNLHQIVN